MNHRFSEKLWKMHKVIFSDIKVITTKARRSYLVSEPNNHQRKIFFRKFFTHRNEKSIDNDEKNSLFRSINTGNKYIFHV